MFVPFNVKTDLSIYQGVGSIEAYIAAAEAQGVSMMALTDTSLSGAYAFAMAAQRAGIKPIHGLPVLLRDEARQLGTVTLYAANKQGMQTLSKVAAKAALRSGFPSLDITDFVRISAQDTFLLTGDRDTGFLYRLLKEEDPRTAADVYTKLATRWGNHLRVEISRNDLEDVTSPLDAEIAELVSRLHPREFIGTISVRGVAKDDARRFDLIRDIADKTANNNTDGINYLMPTLNRVKELFPASDYQLIENGAKFAMDFDLCFSAHPIELPKFAAQTSDAERLATVAQNGLAIRLGNNAEPDKLKHYQERLHYELKIVADQNFDSYFLVVADFVRWAKREGIPVGPGRGSGVGSLLSYAMGITEVDPIRHGLLFERFLNPDRHTYPDIDIDIAASQRDRVTDYVVQKYGSNFVSTIETHNKIGHKTAVRELIEGGFLENLGEDAPSREQQLSFIKRLPTKMTEKARARLDKIIAEGQPWESELVKAADAVAGLTRSHSTHPAGLLISGSPIADRVPVIDAGPEAPGKAIISIDDAKAAGLVKFDILSLKTLDMLAEAERLVKSSVGGQNFSLRTIGVNDPRIHELISSDQTTGLFQLENPGMRSAIRTIQPQNFNELMDTIALFRPGPMDHIQEYQRRKTGVDPITVPAPVEVTEPILKSTYGIIVYQEQVMQIVSRATGWNLAQADLLRRDQTDGTGNISAWRTRFVASAIENDINKEEASNLFDAIESQGGFAFNKSHAAAYTLIACQSAWLKRYYPAAFLAAQLKYQGSDATKFAKLLEEAMRAGVTIEMPTIQSFHSNTQINGNRLMLGIDALERIGIGPEGFSESQTSGSYPDMAEFVRNLPEGVGSNDLYGLSVIGFFDSIEPNRHKAYRQATHLLVKGADQSTAYISPPDWPDRHLRQRDILGYLIDPHPAEMHYEDLKHHGVRYHRSIAKHMVERAIPEIVRPVCATIDQVSTQYAKSNDKPYLRLLCNDGRNTFWAAMFFDDKSTLEATRHSLNVAKNGLIPLVLHARLRLNEENYSSDPVSTVVSGTENISSFVSARLYDENAAQPLNIILRPDDIVLWSQETSAGQDGLQSAIKRKQVQISNLLKHLVDDNGLPRDVSVTMGENTISLGILKLRSNPEAVLSIVDGVDVNDPYYGPEYTTMEMA